MNPSSYYFEVHCHYGSSWYNYLQFSLQPTLLHFLLHIEISKFIAQFAKHFELNGFI